MAGNIQALADRFEEMRSALVRVLGDKVVLGRRINLALEREVDKL